MARDGSGNYALPEAAFASGDTISSTKVNSNFSDIAAALTASIAKDGQTTPTANLPMGGYKHTGLGAGSAATDSATLGQVQAQAYIWCGTASGTADAITLSPSPAITAYAAGQCFRWISSASPNTGAMTIAVSGLTAKAAQNDGAALAAGDHAASKMFEGIYDGTAFQIRRVRLGGSGDVTGPASATDSAVALFDGTGGKTLKNGVVIGTGANNLVQLDGSGALPAVDGSALTGIAGIVTFVSAEQTITNAADYTLAHSLGKKPIGAQVWIICKTAELNYSIGDEVLLPQQTGDYMCAVDGIDTTNVYLKMGASGIYVQNKTTGSAAAITNGNWKIIARAWA